MKRIETICMALLLSVGLWAKGERQTVVFDVNIHCDGCIEKIEKSITFERGVKDLECDLKEKTVAMLVGEAGLLEVKAALDEYGLELQ